MKTIKIIDILCYISTGDYDKLPKEFEYAGYVWHWCVACQTYETRDEDKNEMNLYKYFATEGNLNDEVEILDEEDEFEDIEELEIGYSEKNPSNKYIINEYGTKCYLTKHSRIMADKINDLIKNQKLIINKLKEEGK